MERGTEEEGRAEREIAYRKKRKEEGKTHKIIDRGRQ